MDSGSAREQSRIAVGAVSLLLVAVAVGAGGYFVGSSSGEDGSAAVSAAREEGTRDGAVAGERRGRKVGERQGRSAYKTAYKSASKKSYEKTLNDAAN